MVDVQALVDAVENMTTNLDNLIAFVENLRQQLNAELANDPAAQALVDQALNSILLNSQKISNAMNQNLS